MGLQSLADAKWSDSNGELRGLRPRRREDDDDDVPRGVPRGSPPLLGPRLAGRVSKMCRWCAAGGGGGGRG